MLFVLSDHIICVNYIGRVKSSIKFICFPQPFSSLLICSFVLFCLVCIFYDGLAFGLLIFSLSSSINSFSHLFECLIYTNTIMLPSWCLGHFFRLQRELRSSFWQVYGLPLWSLLLPSLTIQFFLTLPSHYLQVLLLNSLVTFSR